jgi:Fur family peroxide stress response transcriptional regulator
MGRAKRRETPNRLDDLEAACRRQGLPITVQRRVILETLAQRDDHPTADEIFVHVRRRLPEVSRTTVYRVLDTLVRLGLAVKLSHPGSGARFDPRTERHHHVVCTRCEKVLDLHLPALDALPLPTAGAFEVSDYSVHFRGVCGDCRDRGSRRRVSA